jgi:hypothetical protein
MLKCSGVLVPCALKINSRSKISLRQLCSGASLQIKSLLQLAVILRIATSVALEFSGAAPRPLSYKPFYQSRIRRCKSKARSLPSAGPLFSACVQLHWLQAEPEMSRSEALRNL